MSDLNAGIELASRDLIRSHTKRLHTVGSVTKREWAEVLSSKRWISLRDKKGPWWTPRLLCPEGTRQRAYILGARRCACASGNVEKRGKKQGRHEQEIP